MSRIKPRRSRRMLLKGLAVTLPAAWSRPVVEAVVLPAHAQTSPGTCSAETGCYRLTVSGRSFTWPGGTGPFVVNVFADADCNEDPGASQQPVVVAVNTAAAAALLSCPLGLAAAEVPTFPALSGCGFFSCQPAP